jgi:DNA methylase
MTPNRKQDIAYSMSALIDPDSYDDVIFRYGLTALYNGGDLQIENVDLALTKDGDLRLGAIPYNAMFRLVQSWRYNAPAMRLMFDTIYELRNAKPELEQNLEEILSRGPALGRFLPSTDVPLYHAANDAIGATEVSRSALAGSLIIVVGSLLGREELRSHPTVTPVALVADAMRDCTRRRDIVLDTFSGSGTTITRSEALRRHRQRRSDADRLDTVETDKSETIRAAEKALLFP